MKEAAVKGELSRGGIHKIVEMSERTARNVTKSLLEEGLLIADSDWHKSSVRFGFPVQATSYLFPKFFPDNVG